MLTKQYRTIDDKEVCIVYAVYSLVLSTIIVLSVTWSIPIGWSEESWAERFWTVVWSQTRDDGRLVCNSWLAWLVFLYVANTHRMQSQSGPKLIISLGIVFTSLTVCLVGTPKTKVHVVHSPNNCVSNFLYTSLYVGPYQGQGYGQYNEAMYQGGQYPQAGQYHHQQQQQQFDGT